MEVHQNLKNAIQAWAKAWQNIHDCTLLHDEEQLMKIPNGGGWSIQQIIQHLNLSERLSLQYVRKKLTNPGELKNAGIASYLRLQLLHISLASPFRFKAPPLVNTLQLPDGETFEETMSKLSLTHQKLTELAKEVDPQLAKKEVFKHPLAGRLPLPGMYWFFTWHIRHHEPQIQRLLDKSQLTIKQGFPQ